MIFVITGKPGHGKTAYAVKELRLLLSLGDVIYSNTKLYPRKMFSVKKYKKLFGDEDIEGDIALQVDRENPNKKILYYQNFAEWSWFKDGTVFCDEGLRYFNARKWESLSEQMTARLTEHRKDKINIYITIQDFSFIDKQIRMMCESFIHCELKVGSAEFKKTLLPRFTKVTEIDKVTLTKCENMGIDPYNCTPEDAEKLRLNIIAQGWFWIKPKIFNWYDTSAKVGESRPERLIHMIRTCPDCNFVRVSHT